MAGDSAARIWGRYLPGLLHQRQQLLALLHPCSWIENTYRLYGLAPDPSLEPNRRRIQEDHHEIASLFSRCQQSPSTPLTIPVLEALAVGSPRLNVALSDGPTMGGQGGDAFAYADRSNAIRRRRRLVQVGLRSGSSDRGTIELGEGARLQRIPGISGMPNGRGDQLQLVSSDGPQIGGGAGRGSN